MQKQQHNTNKPIFSIVIPTYNAGAWLEDCIKSIINQDISEIQLIIVDGCSNDQSPEIFEKYKKYIDVLVSATDDGIYDAMNKGIERAIGNWLYFLGADDQLMPNILHQVVPYLHPEFSAVYGNIKFDNGQIYKSKFGWRTFFQNTVHHQGAFYNRTLFDSFRYNSKLRILSDYELNLVVYLKKLSTNRVPLTIALCHSGGASSNMPLSLRETNEVRSYYTGRTRGLATSLLLKIYYFYKKIK